MFFFEHARRGDLELGVGCSEAFWSGGQHLLHVVGQSLSVAR